MAHNAWGVEAATPLGTWVREFVYVPFSGNLTLYRTNAYGKTSRDYGYMTPGFKYVWFYADLSSMHTIAFSIDGMMSNEIKISAS